MTIIIILVKWSNRSLNYVQYSLNVHYLMSILRTTLHSNIGVLIIAILEIGMYIFGVVKLTWTTKCYHELIRRIGRIYEGI